MAFLVNGYTFRAGFSGSISNSRSGSIVGWMLLFFRTDGDLDRFGGEDFVLSFDAGLITPTFCVDQGR